MSAADANAALEAIKASLAEALPGRHVERSLVDPGSQSAARLTAGVLCLVSGGGGKFANYRGREGELGTVNAHIVGYLQVPEKSQSVAIEVAELQLLRELLEWIGNTAVPGIDVMTPGDWQQSQQLEHPFGWLSLAIEIKP